jgi:hypothetical protein
MLLSPACQSLYVAISFPWSLAVVIGTFLLLDFYLIRKANRRLRNGHSESSVFVSLSSLFSSVDDNRATTKNIKYPYCDNARLKLTHIILSSDQKYVYTK